MKAFTVRRTGVDNGVPEGRYGIALITQRVADNVRILFFRCVPAAVVYFIDLGVG